MIAQTVANTAGRTLKKCARLSDFMPVRETKADKRNQLIAALEAAAGGGNGQ